LEPGFAPYEKPVEIIGKSHTCSSPLFPHWHKPSQALAGKKRKLSEMATTRNLLTTYNRAIQIKEKT